MTYEDYCQIEGLEMSLAEKKAYEAGQRDVAHDIVSCFGISSSLEEEQRFLFRLLKATDMEID